MPTSKHMRKSKPTVLKLDFAPQKEAGFVGVVEDLKLDPTKTPFKIKSGTYTLISAAHIVHTIGRGKPFIKWMDECWRILKVGGQMRISSPYAGNTSYWSDPRSVNGITAQTFFYFDPLHPTGLYSTFKPKPWELSQTYFQHEGMVEVLLIKRAE